MISSTLERYRILVLKRGIWSKSRYNSFLRSGNAIVQLIPRRSWKIAKYYSDRATRGRRGVICTTTRSTRSKMIYVRGVDSAAGKDVRSLGKATLFFVLRYLRVTESAFHSNINDVAV